MKVLKAIVVLMVLIPISCASRKEQEKVTYTNTDGLNLRYEIKDKNHGWLFINVHQDSLPFNYEVKKSIVRVMDSKSLKYKNISVFEYQINYLNSLQNYPILNKFKILYSSKRKSVFNYDSHTK